jgi:hypothetical protein
MRPAARGDNRFPPQYQQSQGKLHYAIIDEVDNILIDEARTPLIISGPAPRRRAEVPAGGQDRADLETGRRTSRSTKRTTRPT